MSRAFSAGVDLERHLEVIQRELVSGTIDIAGSLISARSLEVLLNQVSIDQFHYGHKLSQMCSLFQ